MKAPLYSLKGVKTEDVELNDAIYNARVNERLLELIKNAYAANLRRGTASTKGRAEVRGGGKKPWKQKGTGRARASSIRSPLWRGGGTVFGPKPRSYFVALPSTMRRSALISALSKKVSLNKLLLVEEIALKDSKTKGLMVVVNALPLEKKKTLCVVKNLEPNLERASNNIKGFVEFRKASDVNAYHVIQRERLIIEIDALPVLEERLTAKRSRKKIAEEGA
mgnify:CR=1 FL=1